MMIFCYLIYILHVAALVMCGSILGVFQTIESQLEEDEHLDSKYYTVLFVMILIIAFSLNTFRIAVAL